MSASSEAAVKSKASVARRRTLATYTVVLHVVGLLLSVQLFANHFSASRPAVCEMGKYVSCATVQNSRWGFLLGVPVAFHGIVFFLIGFAFAIYLAGPREDDRDVAAAYAVYQVIGLLSVVYFIVGEVVLGAVCPLCTGVHIIVLLNLFLSLKIVRLRAPTFSPTPASLVRLAWSMRIWLLVAVLVAGTPVLTMYVLQAPDKIYSDAQLSDFGKCLAKQRMTLYMKPDCPYCIKQKELLGPATKLIAHVECTDSTMAACEAEKIYAFPTWVKKSNSAYIRDIVSGGLQTISQLSEITGCKIKPE